MKFLYLCRHAHAGDSPAGDFHRELTADGVRQAQGMGWMMKNNKVAPDIVISSPAARALQTAETIAEILGYPPQKILQEERFYTQDFEKIIAFLRGLHRDFHRPMVVGHNPVISDLTAWLTGEPVRLPVGAYAVMKVPNPDWVNSIRFRSCLLRYPKDRSKDEAKSEAN